MRFTAALGALCATFTLAAASTDAEKVLNNPVGASYSAELPQSNKTALRGSIVATTTEGETKDEHVVNFLLSISGLPSEGGPFTYHIHDKPVPADGNCTGTTGHLDPFGRGDSPACDKSKPETCEVGDLSGKHGKINSSAISSQFNDAYVALIPGNAAYFGNRSFVVHSADKTRLGCANFTVISAGAGVNATNSTGSASSSGSGSSASSTGSPSSSPSSAAGQNAAGRNGVASGAAALVMAVCAAALL